MYTYTPTNRKNENKGYLKSYRYFIYRSELIIVKILKV